MAGDDLVKGGAGSSATDVFGTVTERATKEKEPVREKPVALPAVATPPAEAAPVATPSSAGFTQLLRALNYDQVHHEKAKDVGQEVSAESRAGAAEKVAVPASSAQVTSFLPQRAPGVPVVPAVPMIPAAAVVPAVPVVAPARGSGSFTQLFQQLGAEPVKEEAINKSAVAEASSFTQIPPTAEGAAVPGSYADAAPSSPGSFTQLFARLDADAVGQEAAPVETRMVEAVLVAAAPMVGSFTQMFQTLSSPVDEPVREEKVAVENVPASVQAVEAVPVPVEPVPPRNAPGSFTQLFQTLGSPAPEEARAVPTPPVEATERAAPSAPGSFTQLFGTISEEPRKAQEPAVGPGSFTQLFGSPSAPGSPAAPPASYERPLPVSATGREDSGASRMFATYREPGTLPNERAGAERGPAFSPVEAAPASASAVSSTPSSGGLTQLLRALDGPAQAPKPYAAGGSYAPATPVVGATAGPGSFTGVYGELGAPMGTGPAPVAPVVLPQSVAPQAAGTGGPSEFTRLINASALREAALRGQGEAAPAAASPAAAPGAGGGAFTLPSGLAAMPHASLGGVAAPGASLSGPAGMHGSVSAAGGGHASFSGPKAPHLPAVSNVKMPGMPKAAGAPAGIQKYVPLLLILVLFLLLAVLVAVLLMKK